MWDVSDARAQSKGRIVEIPVMISISAFAQMADAVC
jgi:hypothetical protein